MEFEKYVKLRYEKFGAVVFDTLNEKVYATNETGKEILSLIADGLATPAICENLSQGREQDAATIQNDVTEFVTGLQDAGLLAPSTEVSA